MNKMSCPYCECVTNVNLVTNREESLIKGKNVSFVSTSYVCKNCGEKFETSEQMDRNVLAAKEAYMQKYETVSPENIIKIRESYSASQKAFGLILGMGELTINSYEQCKSVPSTSNRLLLQLASNPFIFYEMYQINKDKIGFTQRDRIENSENFQMCRNLGGIKNIYEKFSKLKSEKNIQTTTKETSSAVDSEVASYFFSSFFPSFVRKS